MAPIDYTPGARVTFDDLEVLEPQERLLRDLRTGPHGLSSNEASRRLDQYGANALRRHGGPQWPRQLARQLTHPLALLLWLAAALSFAIGSQTIGFAMRAGDHDQRDLRLRPGAAGRARGGGARRLHASACDGACGTARRCDLEATELVPGDVVLLEEGERDAADIRRCRGAVELDLSTLTGESQPVAALAPRCTMRGVPQLAGAGPGVHRHDRAPAGRRAGSSSRPACTRSWAGSPRCPSASRRSRARSSARCAGWRG